EMTRSDAAAAGRSGDHVADAPGRECFGAELLGEKTLECANRYGRVDLAPPARVLAWRAASAAADGRDRIGRSRDAIGFGQASFGDQLNVAARVGLDRARIKTRHVLAEPPQVAGDSLDRISTEHQAPRLFLAEGPDVGDEVVNLAVLEARVPRLHVLAQTHG